MEHRVDAHHHLWDLTTRPLPWIDPVGMAVIDRSFGIADLSEVLSAAQVDHTVVVEAASLVAETEELLALAAREPVISGVVGFVELAAPDAGEQIDRLRSLPGGDLLVGIRSPVQDEPDPSWLLRDEVLSGLCAVADRGLAYDLLILPSQIEAAVGAVALVPDGRFVVDHIAKPRIAERQWEPWASAMTALAAHEHVACKVSGMVTEADWGHWSIDDLRPYVDHVLSRFGPERLVFGTDWPVCTLAAPYDTVVEVAEQLTADLSEAERAAFFGGNATQLYRLRHRDS